MIDDSEKRESGELGQIEDHVVKVELDDGWVNVILMDEDKLERLKAVNLTMKNFEYLGF